MNQYNMIVYSVETTNGLQWNVEFPDVSGCGGAGANIEEAIADAKINLEAHLEFLKEEGMTIPVPKDYYKGSEFSGKISLRLAKSLHKEAAKFAEQEGVSINSLINIALAKYIGTESYKHKLEEQYLATEYTYLSLKTMKQLTGFWKESSERNITVIGELK